MLAQKTAIGGVWMVGARLLARVIDLVSMLVLARILEPHDFGLVAIAVSIVTVMETALEMPVSQALVRLPTITRRQYDTAFTLSLLRGGLLTLVLLLIALPFSSFYGDHRLALLVAVLSIGSTARGLVSPRLARFQKSMSFWRDFTLELGGKVVAFAASTTVALATGSYWALAFGTVIFPIAAMIGSYILAPYRPRLSLAELPVFTGFIGWFSVAQVINSVNWQFERLLLGQLMSTARLGLFTASSDVASIPFMSLFTPVLRPLLAAFSQVHSDRPRLKQSYMSASNAVVAIGLPLLVGEALAADPAVRLILGEKWLDAVPLVQWLALSLIPALIAMPAIPLVMAVGQTRLFVYRSLLEFSVKLPVAIAGAIQFGFFGIIAARFLSEVVTGTYCIVWVKRLTGISALSQLGGAWRSIASTCAMVPPVLLLCRHLGSDGGAPHAALNLLLIGSVGASIYAGVLLVLWLVSGRPRGIEAMVANAVVSRLGPRATTAMARIGL